jgi:circadian clock protein KaiC
VYPRLVASEHRRPFESGRLTSGVAALDALLGGGLDRGTSALLMGPAGSGKSSIAVQYAVTAAEAGERAAVFTFDESLTTLYARSAGLGMDLRGHAEAGRIQVHQVDPAEMSPGEFAYRVRQATQEDAARVVVIDSLNGYMNAMPEERFLTIQLHELLTYLGQQGVVTFLVVAQHGLVGSNMVSPVDASYLADSVILLRYFESRGRIQRAISVLKKRSSAHEDTLREMRMGPDGIWVGEPLENFHGVLTGLPEFTGSGAARAGGVNG